MKNQDIYLSLKSPVSKLRALLEQIVEMRNLYPNAKVSIDGMCVELDRVSVALRINVPLSNSDLRSIAALEFVHEINKNLYAFSPAFTHPTTEDEKGMAERIMSSLFEQKEKPVLAETTQISREYTKNVEFAN